jgi:hypothetical protein
MIKLSNVVSQIIQGSSVRYFFLVSIGANKHYTSAPFDITMSNGVTYSSEGGLLGVDPPSFSSSVDRATYSVSFADVSSELKAYFEEGATGDTLEVRVGFYNTLGAVVNGVNPGEIFTNLVDSVLIYKGVIDSQLYEIDVNNGAIGAKIEGSSPMADLDLVNPFYTNKDSLRQRNPADTSFDKVFEGSGKIQLKWGKV